MKPKNIFVIASVCIFFSSCAGNTPEPAVFTAPQNSNKTKMSGREIFEAQCISCHGKDGTAGIAGAANLRVSTADSERINSILHNGRGAMTAFKSTLTNDEIDELVIYVQQLRK